MSFFRFGFPSQATKSRKPSTRKLKKQLKAKKGRKSVNKKVKKVSFKPKLPTEKQVNRFLERKQLKAIPLQQYYATPPPMQQKEQDPRVYRSRPEKSSSPPQKKFKIKREKTYREASSEETSSDEA